MLACAFSDCFVVEPMENALLEEGDEEGDGEGDESDGISAVSEVCACLLLVHVLTQRTHQLFDPSNPGDVDLAGNLKALKSSLA